MICNIFIPNLLTPFIMKTTKFIRLSTLALLTTFSVLILNSCSKEKEKEDPAAQETYGTVSGRVLSANLNVPIAGATVECKDHSTKTNVNGEFTLSVPTGNQTLVIYTGDGDLFKTEMPVNVEQNEEVTLDDEDCSLRQIGTMAYVAGMFDKIERIIIDSLGYSATQLQPYDLMNAATFTGLDAIFINCDNEPPLNTSIYNNLSNFYLSGGSIYASDFAVEYLTGDGNPGPGQHHCDHQTMSYQSTCVNGSLGGFIADSALCTTKMGLTGLVPDVKILDIDIINALGKDSLDIQYDLGGWEVISSVDVPFHTIMEKTTGYPNGPVAVKTDPMEGAGTIFFTTFHNEPQGTISQDVKNILQFFILNL